MIRASLHIALLAAAVSLSACARDARPAVPETVTVVVERYRDLPEWATQPLPKPEAANGTVGARLHNEEARGGVIDLGNCHRDLLSRLDRGESVDPKACARD
ncbi:hypothetical protein ACHZ97_04255 [Lysobacter soli]|uniref:hypothetical protein n=1 Tax=Lysobacter soli TaxID=453783 RepID=UPI0037CCC03C